ncbi:MAG: flavin reductase domain protein FMN-binding protein [Acidimicrobiales bacterium]|nr:flavin reductase domain protein FMN-binding protein [Acidimicrobiales bacterium]
MTDPEQSDPDEVADALVGSLDHPMTIVTTVAGHERAGCLVGFHVQCGIEPLRYAVWLSKANRTYRVGVFAEVFALHFPQSSATSSAVLFGSETGDEVDKFSRCPWRPGPEGVPLLDGIDDWIVGRRIALLDVDADHVCVVLAPIAAHRSGATDWLQLSDVLDLDPGHQATERPHLG